MTDAEYQFLRLLWDDPKISTLIGRIILIAIVVSIFLERHTKLKPWTHLIQWIAKVANGQLFQRMEKIEEKVDKIQKDQEKMNAESRAADQALTDRMDLEKAEAARRRILRFSDELSYRTIDHSQEMFDDVLEDIDTYKSYYDDPKHKNIKNGRARHASALVDKIYQEKLETGEFITRDEK